MATITAGDVKKLRDQTGAGMMDCKAALSETSGDMEAAVDWLRAKGLAKAAKKASRVAAEGLVGVAVAGRPVARPLDDGKTIEVLRVCTDGTPNCCSFLYARVAKIALLFGYTRVITYTLEEESGASLRAVGGRVAGRVEALEWSTPSRPRKSQAVYRKEKFRWEL